MTNPNIDFSAPWKEILRQKAQLVKEQIEELTQEYEEIMNTINGGMDSDRTLVGNVVKRQARPPKVSNGVIVATGQKAISQSIVRPLVEQFLKDNKGKHRTTDIYDYISLLQNAEPRRSWITAISLALTTLSNGKRPRVAKTDTDNGNIKEYEWIQ